MLLPVQRTEHIRFTRKKPVHLVKEKQEKHESFRDETEKRKKRMGSLLPAHPTTLLNEQSVDDPKDYDKAIDQYLYRGEKTLKFEAKV